MIRTEKTWYELIFNKTVIEGRTLVASSGDIFFQRTAPTSKFTLDEVRKILSEPIWYETGIASHTIINPSCLDVYEVKRKLSKKLIQLE